MSRITEQQKKVLESFSIERLSASDINLRLVGSFSNPKSDSLTNKIQSDAYEEDENGSVAYYVIKDTEGSILFYFSLKCGQLYDKLIEKEQLRLIKNLFKYFDEIEKEKSTSDEDRKLIMEIRESVRASKGTLRRIFLYVGPGLRGHGKFFKKGLAKTEVILYNHNS